MIKSMTGFGRHEISRNNKKITIEIKSVNHRFLDISIKMPKTLNMFDASIRNLVKEYAVRGKIDIYISYEDLSENKSSLKYNHVLAKEYVDYFRKMGMDFKIENDVTVSVLSGMPDVLVLEEEQTDQEELYNLVEECLKIALDKFVESRISEGSHLMDDLLKKLDNIGNIVDYINDRSPVVMEEYKNRLKESLREVMSESQIDENRIAAEMVIYADKVCVDEEMVRLKSHVMKMKDELSTGTDVGRKLDFLAQELNREANTILSKSNDLEVTNKGIDLKTEIEKVREQIQNIE